MMSRPPQPRFRPLAILLCVGAAACAGGGAGTGGADTTAAPPAAGAATADTAGPASSSAQPVARIQWGMVMHGGAGTITRASMTPEMEKQYRAKMTEALETGYRVLQGGGSSVDAVEKAINVLEDSPLFNAGKGAVFAADSTNQMDSAIMDGTHLQAGAVAGVMHVRNPISLARLVMERSKHVLLTGAGAEAFARANGVQLVPASYFRTEHRFQQLLDAERQESEATGEHGPRQPDAASDTSHLGFDAAWPGDHRFGTVGAVALDRDGDIAAGTSTGGLTNKKWGRVGDSPLIGSGTYANAHCGVSATGTGEYFIRNVVAHDVCARRAYQHVTLAQSADWIINHELRRQNGDGGVITLDDRGEIAWPFNTEGMYRGYVDSEGKVVVQIYRPEQESALPAAQER